MKCKISMASHYASLLAFFPAKTLLLRDSCIVAAMVSFGEIIFAIIRFVAGQINNDDNYLNLFLDPQ
jgi:hypothetical protein